MKDFIIKLMKQIFLLGKIQEVRFPSVDRGGFTERWMEFRDGNLQKGSDWERGNQDPLGRATGLGSSCEGLISLGTFPLHSGFS